MDIQILQAHPLFLGNMAAETAEDEDRNWVSGDGGPLVVLQASAVPKWQGAMGSEDGLSDDDEDVTEVNAEAAHLYPPGEVTFETDYDAACFCGDYVTRRYDLDMLVLEDSEWSGRFLLLESGGVGVVQVQCRIDNLPEAIEKALLTEPGRTGVFQMQAAGLRLMVGADTHEDCCGYGFSDVPVTPGGKHWKRYEFESGWLFVIE